MRIGWRMRWTSGSLRWSVPGSSQAASRRATEVAGAAAAARNNWWDEGALPAVVLGNNGKINRFDKLDGVTAPCRTGVRSAGFWFRQNPLKNTVIYAHGGLHSERCNPARRAMERYFLGNGCCRCSGGNGLLESLSNILADKVSPAQRAWPRHRRLADRQGQRRPVVEKTIRRRSPARCGAK
jgi:hypothetical protein